MSKNLATSIAHAVSIKAKPFALVSARAYESTPNPLYDIVRAEAITIGPPCLLLHALINFLHDTTICKLIFKPTINQIALILKMENPLWSSPPHEGEQSDWKTPPCRKYGLWCCKENLTVQ